MTKCRGSHFNIGVSISIVIATFEYPVCCDFQREPSNPWQ